MKLSVSDIFSSIPHQESSVDCDSYSAMIDDLNILDAFQLLYLGIMTKYII